MDEVEGHRGRGPDEIVEPVNEAGERSDTDDTERGLGTGGHRLDASPGETAEQAGRERSMRSQGTRRVLTLPLPSRGKMPRYGGSSPRPSSDRVGLAS